MTWPLALMGWYMSAMLPLPHSANLWLVDFLESLRRRHRALKHKLHSIECERVFEEVDGVKSERIDLRLQRFASSQSLVLRVQLWPDRWAWVDAREGGRNGWTLEWNFQGRAAGRITGQQFVAALEETLHELNSGVVNHDKLGHIWAPILLVGPRSI